MKPAEQCEFTIPDDFAAPKGNIISSVAAVLAAAVTHKFMPRFDPTMLTEAQRPDIGIGRCEVDLFEALNGPLIK